MSAAVRTGIKRVVKMSVISALASTVTVLGSPVVAGLALVLITLILALGWVLNDRDRSDRLTKIIYACKGTAAPRPADPVSLCAKNASIRSSRKSPASR